MNWIEQEADVKPSAVHELLRELPVLDVLSLLSRVQAGSPVIALAPVTRAGITAHLRTRRTELGGLLLGRPYLPSPGLPDDCAPIVAVDHFVPSRTFRTSRVSLSMDTEIWNRARAATMAAGSLVVGWYHSHPDLGAFFSGTDRTTQRAFFNQRYSVGLVIDPVRDDEAWFLGPESVVVSPYAVLTVELPPPI
jgi:proteasome lid subunit RPN8/RPN11